jgi:hypothetical protein
LQCILPGRRHQRSPEGRADHRDGQREYRLRRRRIRVRAYAKALDDLLLFAASRPLTLALLIGWLTAMNKLSPSTVNVRLSAMRKLVTGRKADESGQSPLKLRKRRSRELTEE